MTLAYDVAGDGPALVLLHSGVCDRRMWDAQWPTLVDAGYRVVRCDFRGFGQTPATGRSYSNAADVLELLDGMGIERTALVGASYGGQVALEIAALRPDLVSALVLVCSALPGHVPSGELVELGEREDALLEAGDVAGAVELMVDTWLGPEADDAAREAVRQMQELAFEVQLAAAEEFDSVDPDINLATVRAPALALSGAHDLRDFRQIAAHLPGLLGDARHVELPWAGHLPNLERPAAIADLLVAYLHERHPSA